MRRPWQTCGNCTHYVQFGEGGECRQDGPAVPTPGHSGRYPQVGYAEPGCGRFVLDGDAVFARIEELHRRLADTETELDELKKFGELCDGVEQENGQQGGRLPLATITEG